LCTGLSHKQVVLLGGEDHLYLGPTQNGAVTRLTSMDQPVLGDTTITIYETHTSIPHEAIHAFIWDEFTHFLLILANCLIDSSRSQKDFYYLPTLMYQTQTQNSLLNSYAPGFCPSVCIETWQCRYP
jgi:hypothetical protein